MLTPQEQMRIILKGAHQCVNEEELLMKLTRSYEQNRPLNIKFGMDPSAPDIHLGHAVPLRKIRQLQELGHQVIIIIGDFTGKIGDPTGRSKGRVALSDEQVKENALTYCEQIFKIIDRDKTILKFNSEWLSKLNFEDVIRLASTTTVARMLERDDFQNRYKNGVPIGIHEFFYPLMQAYDSIEIEADIELGGTDQTFNVLMGRTLQKALGKEQQIALFMPILEGLDGVEKMSKSLGNYIGVSEPAEVMFKKVMEIPDDLIIRYYELTTDEHPDTIDKIKERLANGENPRDIKLELARIVTELYHDDMEVEKAAAYYEAAFSKKAIPDDIPEVELESSMNTVADIVPKLVAMEFVKSKSEFIRLIKQGGVQLNGEKLSEDDIGKGINAKDVLKLGKKKFVRVKM
ncbi:MAG: tyrosine--tRNA ligase [Lachnospiraceae bacterium]|nr:tyrosine--tRNA ligase [Lachnospiraceae bacterium]